MAAVSFDLKFTYVLAGWEGSAHDALILADAIEENDGFTVLAGKQPHLVHGLMFLHPIHIFNLLSPKCR
jgi:hypothetical protein